MTIREINRAVNDRILAAKRGTPLEMIPLVEEDLSKPIRRPSLKVEIEDSHAGRWGGCCAEYTLTVHIYSFAADAVRPKRENIAMRECLEAAFLNDLLVAGAAIPIDEVESTVTDGVLICSFDLYRVELMADNDQSPPMEELNFRKG